MVRFWDSLSDEIDLEFIMARALQDIVWEHDHNIPRSVAFCTRGDCKCSYTYGRGITSHAQPYPPWLHHIHNRMEKLVGARFNSVNLNLYLSGQQSVTFHDDNETLFKTRDGNFTIGSFSVGQERIFKIKHRQSGQIRDVNLTSGSVVTMEGLTQSKCVHAVEADDSTEARINFTFRQIVSHQPHCPRCSH